MFGIGDTLCAEGQKFSFEDFPLFPPERFARVQPKDTMKRKQFLKGITQLTQEGAVQLFYQEDIGVETFIVGAVGTLQFEVLEYRLKNEYNVDILMNFLPYELARWMTGDTSTPLKGSDRAMVVKDAKQRPVALFANEWSMRWICDNNPQRQFHVVPVEAPAEAQQ